MNTNIAYLVIASLLVMVFLVTRNIKTVDSEYFVLDKTEKTFGLTMSFYASGMRNLRILNQKIQSLCTTKIFLLDLIQEESSITKEEMSTKLIFKLVNLIRL